jgi:hypothetical protein
MQVEVEMERRQSDIKKTEPGESGGPVGIGKEGCKDFRVGFSTGMRMDAVVVAV